MTTLPNKPSELIALALDDLRKVERSKKYEVKMWEWHRFNEERKVCYVCLAGAVMAKTLNAPHQDRINPDNFMQPITGKLCALDSLREGCVSDAFLYLNENVSRGRGFDRDVTSYDDDPKQFKKDMRKLAIDLREAGH